MLSNMELLTKLRDRLQERADQSYCDMIEAASRPESCGWEEKARTGKFGLAELKSHRQVGVLLGKHRAYADARDEVQQMIELLGET